MLLTLTLDLFALFVQQLTTFELTQTVARVSRRQPTSQWRIHRGRGTGPQISGRRQSYTRPPLLTHNDAIAGFTSQGLGLPAYACKKGSSSAIKLAPRMHQKLAILSSKKCKKKFLPDLSPDGDGTTFPTPTPPRRLVSRASHDSSSHFLNRGYARATSTAGILI